MTPLRHSPSAGFTLVELMVAGFITAVIVFTAIVTIVNVERSWDVSQDRVDRTQNMRAALETLVRDVRMAGSGFGGLTLTAGGVPGNRLHCLEPRPVADGPDTLHLIGAFDDVWTLTSSAVPSPASALVLNDATGFAPGDLVVICDRGDADLFQVTDVDAAQNRLTCSSSVAYNRASDHDDWPAAGYAAGSRVSRVSRVSYWVESSDGETRLFRRVDNGDAVPIAFGVDNLSVRYVLNDGTETEDPGDPSLIRAVNIEYLGEPKTAFGVESTEEPFEVRIRPRVIG